MDAEDLLLREFLGIRTQEETEAAARWIRSRQRPDGTWATFHGGPGDLSTTVEAYVALRLAGDPPDAPAHGRRGRVDPGRRRDRGPPGLHPDLAGAVRAVVVGRPAGPAAGADLPARLVPAQRLRLGLLGPADDRPADDRRRAPPGPAAAVRPGRAAHRPAGRAHAGRRRLDEGVRPAGPRAARLRAAPAEGSGDRPPDQRAAPAPAAAVRTAAMRRCAEWIIARQEQDGCWGGIQPPWVYSLIALHLLGYGARPPGDAARPRRAGPVHRLGGHAGRPGPAARGLPVAGLGHRARGDRAARRRPARPTIRRCRRRPTGCWPRRSAGRATGRSAGQGSRRRAGPSSSTTTTTPTSTTRPRSCSRSAG